MIEREDQYRIEVDSIGDYGGDSAVVLTCNRCPWSVDIDDAVSLADLNDRAAEHVEVCQ